MKTIFVLLFLSLFILNGCVFTGIIGDSMEPNLHTGDIAIWVSFTDIDRFDIVYIEKFEKPYAKRIIGLPLEQVQLYSDKICINGLELINPYFKETPNFSPFIINLGPNEYFVMGDNVNISRDSRSFGPVLSSEISYELLFKY